MLADDLRDFPVKIISFIIDLAEAGIPGAKELIESLAQCHDSNLESERLFENTLTEAFACMFLEQSCAMKIQAIENRRHPLRSPHARNSNKSCDILATQGKDHLYFEVKDCSIEFNVSRIAGLRGFTPASDIEKRVWLEKRIKDCFDKGANYLIARLPVWESSSRSGIEAVRDVLHEYELESDSQARIQVQFAVPEWFKGIYLIKKIGCVFVSVVQRHL